MFPKAFYKFETTGALERVQVKFPILVVLSVNSAWERQHYRRILTVTVPIDSLSFRLQSLQIPMRLTQHPNRKGVLEVRISNGTRFVEHSFDSFLRP